MKSHPHTTELDSKWIIIAINVKITSAALVICLRALGLHVDPCNTIAKANIENVTISDSVTSIPKYAFRDCSSLTSITIPDSVISIGRASFSGCSSLTSIAIGNSVTTIGEHAFESCSSLMGVIIPDSVTSIGNATFKKCSGLTRITIEGNAPKNYTSNLFEGVSENAKIFVNAGATGFGETFAGLPVQILKKLKINAISTTDSPFTVSFTTAVGSTYEFQASGDLKNWSKVEEIKGNGGEVKVTDFREALFQKQYYRVKLVD